MSSKVIRFENVTKVYSKYFGILKLKNFLDRIKNGQLGKKLVREAPFRAVDNASFVVEKGESVAIIGRNGAGKSTILKLINKIAYPTTGKIRVPVTVGGLVELGAGFESELTGRDNVDLGAAILGFSPAEAKDIQRQVVEISELDHYIDVPMKKYSSGMRVRLGFALTMATNPDIVLLDEV